MAKWLVFNDAKSHLVCDELESSIIDDLTRRGAAVYKSETIDGQEVAFDMPGMVAFDRPWEDFDFLAVRLSIPSEDIATFIYSLQSLPLRTLADNTQYYKLHGFHRVIVMTPQQRDELLQLLRERVEAAEQRASEFYAVRKLPSEVLREVAAMVNKEPLELVPNLGGNKQDRFKPKGGGGQVN